MATDVRSSIQNVSPFRAGLATMLVGAVLLGAGLLRTTAATPQAYCPDGTTLIAKFEYNGRHDRYDFEKPWQNRNVVSITNADEDGGDWTSSQPIAAIVVKGGPGSKTITLTPPQTSGTFDNEGLRTGGGGRNTPNISNVQFCGPDQTVTTTTASTTTSTTSTTSTTTTTTPTTTSSTTTSSTTTTEPGEETTTSTTSTTAPTTTTTSTTTTTTPDGSTSSTSSSTTSSSVPDDSTTTTEGDGSTTTTEADGTTTTTEPGEVLGEVVVNTTIVADDSAQVLGTSDSRSLPRTGAPSVPLVLVGIVMLGIGGTLTAVNRRRDSGN